MVSRAFSQDKSYPAAPAVLKNRLVSTLISVRVAMLNSAHIVSLPTYPQGRAKRRRASGLIFAALLLTSGRLDAKSALGTNDVAEICWDAGFRDTGLTKAIAVAWAESSFIPDRVNTKNSNGSIDYGLFQFNNRAHKEVSKSTALDPRLAAKEAFRVSKGGTDWHEWNGYQSPQYNNKLNEAKEATALITAIKTINRDAQALSDIKKQASEDRRFGAVKDTKTKFEKEEDGYEFRSARVRWLLIGENKIWHITLKSDPRVRYTHYYDPFKGAFTPWLRH
jgi:hypothetical protein